MDASTQTIPLDPKSMAFLDHGDLVVVLERPEGTKRYNFCEYVVEVKRTNGMKLAEELGLKSAPDADGYRYMLFAEPMDYGMRGRVISLTYEEAVVLRKRLAELREEW